MPARPLIDLYSDTVTRPTPEMYQAMVSAEVGDDMSGLDPTVNRLEQMVCDLFQKEAAVFACSGTQSNQMGVRAHCQPGDELLIEERGHIANFEGGAAAVLSGASARTIPGKGGMLDVPDLVGKVRADDQHLARTRLVCLENTTNGGGGRVYPVEQIHRVCDWAHEHGLKVHLDGARLFNASVAAGAPVSEICRGIDTISVCFSKGLGCPMGSILVGSAEAIAHARRSRKLMGGALRQAGVVAAAAIYALENNVERLADDHRHAKQFAETIAQVDGIQIDPNDVESNLVFFEIDPEIGTARQLVAAVAERGVRIGAMYSHKIRACTHLDASEKDVLEAARVITECVQAGFGGPDADSLGPFSRA